MALKFSFDRGKKEIVRPHLILPVIFVQLGSRQLQTQITSWLSLLFPHSLTNIHSFTTALILTMGSVIFIDWFSFPFSQFFLAPFRRCAFFEAFSLLFHRSSVSTAIARQFKTITSLLTMEWCNAKTQTTTNVGLLASQ